MQTLDIAIEDPRWVTLDIEKLALSSAVGTLTYLDLSPDHCEVSVLACDDGRITVLNGEFREKPTPTNVLSWPAEERAAMRPGDQPILPKAGPDGMIELGDIAISYETCLREATEANRAITAHVTHLIVHGVLHLLGYDHTNDPDAALMEGLETKILGKLGIDDPYRET